MKKCIAILILFSKLSYAMDSDDDYEKHEVYVPQSKSPGHAELYNAVVQKIFRLKKGADINQQDPDNGWSLLHYAYAHGNTSLIQWLKSKGADTHITDSDGWKPDLRRAYTGGEDLNEDERFVFTQKNKSPEYARLYTALIQKTISLRTGANINIQNPENGWTLLHYAVDGHKRNFVEWLINHGADKDIQDNEGYTPALRALFSYNENLVQYLIEHGANVNICTSHGQTLLHLAVMNVTFSQHYPYQGKKFVDFILNEKMNINRRDAYGRTAFHKAVDFSKIETTLEFNNWVHRSSHIDWANTLVEHGADVNTQDYEGNTPLHTAVEKNDIEMVQFLLKVKADTLNKNKDGKTALDLAKEKQLYDIVCLFPKPSYDFHLKSPSHYRGKITPEDDNLY